MEFLLYTPFGVITTTKKEFKDEYNKEYNNEITRQVFGTADSGLVFASYGRRGCSEVFISPDYADKCRFLLDNTEIALNENIIRISCSNNESISLNNDVSLRIGKIPVAYKDFDNIKYNDNDYIFINSIKQLRFIPIMINEKPFYDISGLAYYKRKMDNNIANTLKYRLQILEDKEVIKGTYESYIKCTDNEDETENEYIIETLYNIEIKYKFDYIDTNKQRQTIDMLEIIPIDSIRHLFYKFEDEYDDNNNNREIKYSNFGILDMTYNSKNSIELKHRITKEKRKAIIPDIKFIVNLTKFSSIGDEEDKDDIN